VARSAFCSLVRADQRKTALTVKGGDVFNDPGFRGMASSAIGPCRVFMYIGMAVRAVVPGIGKNQGRVAIPATGFPVAPFKGEARSAVAESAPRGIEFPAFRRMALVTAQGQPVAVRRLCLDLCRHQQDSKERDQWQLSHRTSSIL